MKTPEKPISPDHLRQAAERHENPANTLILVTRINDVPGVSHTTTTVRDRAFPGLGGWRITDRAYLKKNFNEADPAFVNKVLGSHNVPDEAAPSAFESWRLSDDMWKKYANMRRVIRTQIDQRPELFPQEMLDDPEKWLQAAGLIGGVKTVTEIYDMDAFRSMSGSDEQNLVRQHAEHFNELNAVTDHRVGYYTGPDMNSSSRFMTIMRRDYGSRYASSYDEALGGSGDPSPTTARGVVHTTNALVDFLGIPEDELRFAVQGIGAVGKDLPPLLKNAHPASEVFISDTIAERLQRVADPSQKIIPAEIDEIHKKGNIFNPAATAGTVNNQTLSEMIDAGVKGTAPAANAIYKAGQEDELSLQAHAAGITIVPAPHANLGGIFSITREFARNGRGTPSQELTKKAIAMMEPATKELLEEAAAAGVPPQQIFERYAHEEYTRACMEKGLLAA